MGTTKQNQVAAVCLQKQSEVLRARILFSVRLGLRLAINNIRLVDQPRQRFSINHKSQDSKLGLLLVFSSRPSSSPGLKRYLGFTPGGNTSSSNPNTRL